MDKKSTHSKKFAAIFCGANTGNSQEIIDQTLELCQYLIEQDYHLVYGGGKTGLMGIIADYFLKAERSVIGVRPKKLNTEEAAHNGLTEMIIVENMHSRKEKIVVLSDIFIALPGGIGTLDEIVEVYTLRKIGYIQQPCAILNVDGFFDPLENLLTHMVKMKYLKEEDKNLLFFCGSAKELANTILGSFKK